MAQAAYAAPAPLVSGRSSVSAATQALDRMQNAHDAALRAVGALALHHAQVAAIPGAQRFVPSAPTALHRALQTQVDAYAAACAELEAVLVRRDCFVVQD